MAYKWGTKAKRDALTKKLTTLIQGVVLKEIQRGDHYFMDSWQNCLDKDTEMMKSLAAINSIARAKGLSQYKKSLVGLASYLFAVEGGFANYMNLFCLMLVRQGHDLHNFFDRTFARSFDEIANVNMQTKERFLKEHGLELFNEGVNRKLRNAIAHFDFKIEKDGTVKAEENRISINDELDQLVDIMILVHGINERALSERQTSRAKRRQKS